MGNSGSSLAFIFLRGLGEEILTWETKAHYLPLFIFTNLPFYVVAFSSLILLLKGSTRVFTLRMWDRVAPGECRRPTHVSPPPASLNIRPG